jgi:regulator of sigma E protease
MIGTSVVSVVILLGVLVFFHELGHFLLAKAFGVGVLKFSLGFGPRLFGRKRGETEYLVSAIPLGGYVKLLGEGGTEDIPEADLPRSYAAQKAWKRFSIVFAGPLFNFVLAILVFTVINMAGVPQPSNLIGAVQENSAAAEAGLMAGDRIVSVNGKEVTTWLELASMIEKTAGSQVSFKVDRGGKLMEFTMSGRLTPSKNEFGEDVQAYRVGVKSSREIVTVRKNPVMAIVSGFETTWKWTKLTVISVVKLIEGTIPLSTLGGPILIAEMAGESAQHGVISFMLLMAMLSINLGVLNLLPIPVLDGGHLLFTAIEMVTGREVNLKWRELAQQVGFLLLIILMFLVFYNDIVRLIG